MVSFKNNSIKMWYAHRFSLKKQKHINIEICPGGVRSYKEGSVEAELAIQGWKNGELVNMTPYLENNTSCKGYVIFKSSCKNKYNVALHGSSVGNLVLPYGTMTQIPVDSPYFKDALRLEASGKLQVVEDGREMSNSMIYFKNIALKTWKLTSSEEEITVNPGETKGFNLGTSASKMALRSWETGWLVNLSLVEDPNEEYIIVKNTRKAGTDAIIVHEDGDTDNFILPGQAMLQIPVSSGFYEDAVRLSELDATWLTIVEDGRITLYITVYNHNSRPVTVMGKTKKDVPLTINPNETVTVKTDGPYYATIMDKLKSRVLKEGKGPKRYEPPGVQILDSDKMEPDKFRKKVLGEFPKEGKEDLPNIVADIIRVVANDIVSVIHPHPHGNNISEGRFLHPYIRELMHGHRGTCVKLAEEILKREGHYGIRLSKYVDDLAELRIGDRAIRAADARYDSLCREPMNRLKLEISNFSLEG